MVIKSDQAMDPEYRRAIFMIDSASAIEDMPDWAAPGSLAFLADMTAFWVLNVDGETWTESTADALALIGLIG